MSAGRASDKRRRLKARTRARQANEFTRDARALGRVPFAPPFASRRVARHRHRHREWRRTFRTTCPLPLSGDARSRVPPRDSSCRSRDQSCNRHLATNVSSRRFQIFRIDEESARGDNTEMKMHSLHVSSVCNVDSSSKKREREEGRKRNWK